MAKSRPDSPAESLARREPEIAAEWSSRNAVSAFEVLPASNMMAEWDCRTCGHGWRAEVFRRTLAPRRGCPECARHYHHFERGVNDLPTVLPHLAPQWSADNPRPFSEYSATSSREVGWHCDVHGTDWRATPRYRALGYGNCPAMGRKKHLGEEQICAAAD